MHDFQDAKTKAVSKRQRFEIVKKKHFKASKQDQEQERYIPDFQLMVDSRPAQMIP